MPVTFYPSNPILGLENIIVKEDGTPLHGEIDTYKLLYYDLEQSQRNWHVWHSLHLPVHSDRSNPHKKASAEIDFIVLSEEGLLVIEVKGGAISFRDNQFYYGGQFNEPIGNPFTQAQGYKFTIKDKILNDKSIFCCHSVVFPHSDKDFRNYITDHEILWTKIKESIFPSFEDFLVHVFDYNRRIHRSHNRIFPKLSKTEVDDVVKRLSPIVSDANRYIRTDTSQWLNIENLEILESLEKNERIMIEGGPGTGKTTMAKAFIDKQFAKKGLFLCWNNFLMHHTKSVLAQRNLECKVTTVIRFLKEINPQLDVKNLFSLEGNTFYKAVKEILDDYKGNKYNYIIIDETQDIFDKGIDVLLNTLLGKSNSGVENGKYLLLYDLEQGYFGDGRNIVEYADYFSEYCAHFKLNEFKRSSQNPSIKKLAYDILDCQENFHIFFKKWVNLNSGVRVSTFGTIKEIKSYIVTNVLKDIRNPNNSLKGNDCIILTEASLMKENNDENEDFKYQFQVKNIEELTEQNITDTKNALMFTTILKYKGLEKKNVFLVVKPFSTYNKLEYFIGITRAILNLEILILNP